MLRCFDGPTTMTQTIPSSRRWTYADYCRIPADRKRHQIVDGRHFVSPAPSLRHQEVAGRLYLALVDAIERKRRGRVFIAPVDVHLAPGTIVQPDLVVFGTRRPSRIGQKKVTGAPDLLVEILSPSHRTLDTVLKRERYERAGVRELWLVDPDTDSLVQLVLRRGRYVEVATDGSLVRLRALRGITVDLRAVFA
jgi:Uma2 family endonuclease